MLEGPWAHREIGANGIRVHLVVGEHFDPTRPLVLLLHGFAQLWWAWRHQIPALDAAGFSVAAMDLRGYGGTDKTPRGYDPRTTAADVSGVVRSLGFSTATVVGHDWGGMAAWATAAYAPAVVDALALVAAPHPLAFPWRANLARLAFGQLPGLAERRLMTEEGPYRDALSSWPSPQCALAYPRRFVRDWARRSGRDHRRALAPGVRVPVLSLVGSRDTVVPPDAARAAGRWAHGPYALQILEGVGHLAAEEAPQAVNEALVTWLKRR